MTTTTSAFYDVLKAIGPLREDDVPDRVTKQLMSAGFHAGSAQEARAAIALYSRIAAETSREEFEAALKNGTLPKIPLSARERKIALGGDAASAGMSLARCCGHTCE